MSPSAPKPRVLLTGEIEFAHEEWNALSDVATLEVLPTPFIKDRLTPIGGRLFESKGLHQRLTQKV
jgi:hypothetical protein